MFNNTNLNYFPSQSCKNAKENIINDCVNKIFFNNVRKPNKSEQMAAIQSFKSYQDEKLSRGYGKVGFEHLIKNLSSENLQIIENSLELLENELKNTLSVNNAIKLNILNDLCRLLSENLNNANKNLKNLLLTLKLLNLVGKDIKGCQLIAENESLMQNIFIVMKSQTDGFATCAEILQTLIENPCASQNLLNSKYFTDELQNLIHNTSSAKLFSVLSNFIARKPETFDEIEIFKSFINNISKPKPLKCLMLILNCDGCRQHAIEMKIENTLLKVLIHSYDDETKTFAIMALRNYLTYGNIYSGSFPWKQLLNILIEGTHTKINELLQESCIQTLRVMSDVPIVKCCLHKYHMEKLQNIPAKTEYAEHIKKDLLEWLKYRNYKANDEFNKYSKFFV